MSTGNMDVRIGFLLLLVLGVLGTSSARQLPLNLEGTLRILFNGVIFLLFSIANYLRYISIDETS